MSLRPLLIALVLQLAAVPAGFAQRGADPQAVDQLIEQLRPSATTRGIRMPSEAPVTAAPAPAAPIPPARHATASQAAPEPAGVASLRVRFASGSADLAPQAERTLDTLGRALASPELTPYRFRIEGHTDRVGPSAENQTLSERRAAAVREYLAARHGIAPSRLETVGRGEDDPEVATADEVPEARNRRVRVVNLGG